MSLYSLTQDLSHFSAPVTQILGPKQQHRVIASSAVTVPSTEERTEGAPHEFQSQNCLIFEYVIFLAAYTADVTRQVKEFIPDNRSVVLYIELSSSSRCSCVREQTVSSTTTLHHYSGAWLPGQQTNSRAAILDFSFMLTAVDNQ